MGDQEGNRKTADEMDSPRDDIQKATCQNENADKPGNSSGGDYRRDSRRNSNEKQLSPEQHQSTKSECDVAPTKKKSSSQEILPCAGECKTSQTSYEKKRPLKVSPLRRKSRRLSACPKGHSRQSKPTSLVDLAIPSTSSGKCVTEGRLFISNLHSNLCKHDLKHIFKKVGHVKRVRVHFNKHEEPLRTAEVIFFSKRHALRAIRKYNGHNINGRRAVVEGVTAQIPPTMDEMAPMRLFISNVYYKVDNLHYLFGQVGELLSATVHYNRYGVSLGHADIYYRYAKDAMKALRAFSGYKVRGKALCVQMLTSFIPTRSSDSSSTSSEQGNERKRRRKSYYAESTDFSS